MSFKPIKKLVKKGLAKLPHKYAIDAKRLGDARVLAWRNLGDWNGVSDYVAACEKLADDLAASIGLNAQDRLLDLACGQGASLQYWLERYQIQQLSALELQCDLVENIQKQLPALDQVFCDSFLNLQRLDIKAQFDAVLCIDAAYHCSLAAFLPAVNFALKNKGRLGFHYLMRSAKWSKLSQFEQQKYRYLLKMADVELNDLTEETGLYQQLKQQHFDQIEIVDITENVFTGFADYVLAQNKAFKAANLAEFKIRTTAELCRYLYQQGVIRYVRIRAVKRL